jgi:hypothetical protein
MQSGFASAFSHSQEVVAAALARLLSCNPLFLNLVILAGYILLGERYTITNDLHRWRFIDLCKICDVNKSDYLNVAFRHLTDGTSPSKACGYSLKSVDNIKSFLDMFTCINAEDLLQYNISKIAEYIVLGEECGLINSLITAKFFNFCNISQNKIFPKQLIAMAVKNTCVDLKFPVQVSFADKNDVCDTYIQQLFA